MLGHWSVGTGGAAVLAAVHSRGTQRRQEDVLYEHERNDSEIQREDGLEDASDDWERDGA